MARVIAIQRGHDGVQIRETGEVFDVPEERLKEGSTWFVAEKEAQKLAPPTKPKSSRPPGAGPVPGSGPTIPEPAAPAKKNEAEGF